MKIFWDLRSFVPFAAQATPAWMVKDCPAVGRLSV